MKSKRKTVALGIDSSSEGLDVATEKIARGIMRWGRKAGWNMIDLRTWAWQVPVYMKVDGLISNATFQARTAAKSGAVEGMPFHVRIYSYGSKTEGPGVSIDQEAIGLQAAEYFLERGFRSFALAAYRTAEWVQSLRSFKERIERAGGTCKAIQGMHLPIEELEAVRNSVRCQLRQLTYPLGIFCVNDRLAVRLCHWCIENGVAVPEQAAILGYGNNSVMCSLSPVALSSVDPHSEELGFEAARLLQRMMDGETIPGDTMIRVPPSGVVTRRSTDITALADVRAARALRYIWDHYAQNIGPDDVAAACGMSRSTLERHFKASLGRTVAKEITRRRLRRACELLVGGEMDATDIAARVGFGTPQYFNFQFKRRYGITPKRYRERERNAQN